MQGVKRYPAVASEQKLSLLDPLRYYARAWITAPKGSGCLGDLHELVSAFQMSWLRAQPAKR